VKIKKARLGEPFVLFVSTLGQWIVVVMAGWIMKPIISWQVRISRKHFEIQSLTGKPFRWMRKPCLSQRIYL